jgi:hypothetical protein
MEVDQKHITTIRMHNAKGSDVQLVKDGDDFQLRLSSNHNVVNIFLGRADVRKICQQAMQTDVEEHWKTTYMPALEHKSFVFNGAPRSFHETMAGLFARMACDMTEKAEKN